MKSKLLKKFIKEIQFNNRNPKDVKVLGLLDDLSTNPEINLEEGHKLYRCRIILDENGINKEEGFFGYGKKDSFIPPVEKTKDMRANYRYIPYLYCASTPYVAVAESRPRLGTNLSVATIEIKQKLVLLDFTVHNRPNKMTETKINLFSDLSEMFSKPIIEEDSILDYIPTQFIAEYAKNIGYDGIAFSSSVTPEYIGKEDDRYNVVIFNYKKCEPIKSNVFRVGRNYFECEQIDEDEEKIEVIDYFNERIGKIIGKI